MSWSTGREAKAVVTRPTNLKKTVTVAFVVGSIFFATNQLGPILDGHTSAVVLAKSVLTCLVPFCVSNYSLLVASRAPRTELL
jgi:hypothetical protein